MSESANGHKNVEGIAVEGAFGELPAIEFIKDTAPEDLAYEILVEGDGDAIEAGKKLNCNYHGVIWNGDIFDSSFQRGQSISFPIGVGMVIKGWDQVLVGQKIGSRVLISIPPQYGYGSNGMPQAGIKGTDTLVFVVDILGQS